MQCLINSCFTTFFWGEIQCSPVSWYASYRGLCIVIRIVSLLVIHSTRKHQCWVLYEKPSLWGNIQYKNLNFSILVLLKETSDKLYSTVYQTLTMKRTNTTMKTTLFNGFNILLQKEQVVPRDVCEHYWLMNHNHFQIYFWTSSLEIICQNTKRERERERERASAYGVQQI